jgi:L-iditol 2-dehydrogenase
MRVLITGAGPIGLMTLLAAKAAGATVLAITDMVDAKLVVARTLGATYTFKANTPNLVSVAQQAVGGEFDVTFECSGVVPALDLCVSATGSGGVLCVVANYKADEAGRTPVRLQELARREIDLVGVYRYCNLYPTALELVSSGAVNLKPLISRKFSLEQAGHAFEYFATGEPIKVLITPNEAAGDDGCKPCEFDIVSLEKAREFGV